MPGEKDEWDIQPDEWYKFKFFYVNIYIYL